MPITSFLLDGNVSDIDGTSQDTAVVSPTANRLQLLAAYTATAEHVTATGCGLTWVEVDFVNNDPTGNRSLTLLRAMGAPTTGVVTLDVSPATSSRWAWSLIECDGVDTSGANGSGAIQQFAHLFVASNTVITVTLGAFSDAANGAYGAFGSKVANGTPTQGSGFATLHNVGPSSESANVYTEFRDTNDTTVDLSSSVTEEWMGIAVELRAVTSPLQGTPFIAFTSPMQFPTQVVRRW